MHILYKITYKPHLNTNLPKYYIGSKYNYKGNYYGSVDSKKIFDFTENKPLKQWWKEQNKEDFIFEILETFDGITPLKLVELEYELQLKLNVLSEDYFNQAYATKGWVSSKKSKETKAQISDSTKKYWDSEDGMKKKQRLIERNKTTHGAVLRERWKNPTQNQLDYIERQKQSWTDEKRRIQGEKFREIRTTKIEYKGEIYLGWAELETQTGVTKHLYKKYYLNGYDPEINIKRKKPILIPL